MRFSVFHLAVWSSLCFFTLQPAHPAPADQVQAHIIKAGEAVEQRQWDAALVELDAALALDKNNVDAHAGRALVLAQKRDTQGALAAISRVIELEPTNADAWKMRSDLHERAGDNAKSHADFVAFLRLSPAETANLQVAAQAASDQGDWKTAVGLWSMLDEVRPRDARVLYGRGVAQSRSSLAVALESDGADVQRNLARAKADAKASFEAAIQADPHFAPAYIALKDPAVLEQGLKAMPNNPELLIAHGDSFLEDYPSADNIKTALGDYDRALQLNPKSAAALAGRAHAYFWKREYDLSLADSARSLSLQPKNFEALVLRASIYELKSDYGRAVVEYDRALAIQPDELHAAFSRYLALRRLPDKSRALTAISQLIEAKPNSAIYLQSRAELLFDQKDFARALADVDKILELEAGDKNAAALRAKIIAAPK